jgi:hypothetical protein
MDISLCDEGVWLLHTRTTRHDSFHSIHLHDLFTTNYYLASPWRVASCIRWWTCSWYIGNNSTNGTRTVNLSLPLLLLLRDPPPPPRAASWVVSWVSELWVVSECMVHTGTIVSFGGRDSFDFLLCLKNEHFQWMNAWGAATTTTTYC